MWTMIGKQGIGLRSGHQSILSTQKVDGIDFLELSPENWMGLGGFKQVYLDKVASIYPLIAHGLSLSIGGFQPLNKKFLNEIRAFLDDYNIEIYSDHLCFSDDDKGYLYDLLPVPREKENISYICNRIEQVQEIIKRPLSLENISYYYQYDNDMNELDFINAILQRSGAKMLLDINNVYVNGHNHNYNAYEFIKGINKGSVSYYHIAGHYKKDDFILDTHGKDVIQEVKELAKFAVEQHGWHPMLLERDHFVPKLDDLVNELNSITNVIEGKI
ncbi:DUF692 domain-containing protein [Francisella tularensis subsp. holarctica]|nr:DUF692 domain-containing protein [Francisella tularensis subsp. holarctica]MWY46892.1 DUF692 domain-containing protein [Francisella tularensis]MWY54852.1 DUF692 domain-containing protein [Francisella tularensis]MWZ17025.1 DUF692 domain-containing protein [Francisella tularensis]MWZ28187.1 DUF692 domain-containing protein [Francisella tularensis]